MEYLYGVFIIGFSVPIFAYLFASWLSANRSHMLHQLRSWLVRAKANYESEMDRTHQILAYENWAREKGYLALTEKQAYKELRTSETTQRRS